MKPSELREVFRALGRVDSVFMAFNCNVDKIKHVDKGMEKLAKGAKPVCPDSIERPEDIFSALLYSMKYGEPLELTMDSSVQQWISKNVRPDEKRMGGQIGIMANLLAVLGVQAVVYTPMLSAEQRSLFSRNVRLLGRRSRITKENWIFEFSPGQKFMGVTAKNASRLIAASRPDAFRLKKIRTDPDFSCAILSGFHAIKERYDDGTTYKDQFRIAKRLFAEIRAKRKPVHLELAFTKNRKILLNTINLAHAADSVGLDDSELINLMDLFGNRALAKRLHKRRDVADVLSAMEKLSAKIKVKKIHLHGNGYFLAVCGEGYHASGGDIKKSMEFASVVAASKASHDARTKKQIMSGMSFHVSNKGRKAGQKLAAALKKRGTVMQNGIAETGGRSVIFVPIPLVKNVRDIVGLGDVISASIFAAETGFSLLTKEAKQPQ